MDRNVESEEMSNQERADVDLAEGLRVAPQQGRAKRTIDRILDTAGELIVEAGPSGLRTSRIAERADMPIGLIYRYFKDAAAIERAFVERVMADVEAAISKALQAIIETTEKGADVDTLVGSVIDAILSRFAENTGAVELINAISATESYKAADRESNERLAATMAEIFDRAGFPGGEAALQCHARIQIEIGSALQLLAFEAKNEAEALTVIDEWKRAAKAYARQHFAAHG